MQGEEGIRPFQGNILVIDDSDSVRKKIIRVLKRESLVDCCFEAKSGLEGFKLLLEKKIDLVFCDVVMPEFDGFKFLISRSTRPELMEIPVILLTSEADLSVKLKGFEQGASDYITKPFDEQELVARAKAHLRMKFLQDEIHRRNEELKELSGTDELTGVSNRRRFMENLEREFSRARRHKYSLSVAILDVDFFKTVNDQYGHLVGDRVLMEVAQVMKGSLRSSDLLGRYGGEEFTLCLPHTGALGAVSSAERVRGNIEAATFCDNKLKITVSGGVSAFPENPVETIEELIRTADEALYRAKANGRNRIEKA